MIEVDVVGIEEMLWRVWIVAGVVRLFVYCGTAGLTLDFSWLLQCFSSRSHDQGISPDHVILASLMKSLVSDVASSSDFSF
jgi:hypothetical protein